MFIGVFGDSVLYPMAAVSNLFFICCRVRAIEVLASRFGTAAVTAALLPRVGYQSFALLDWCISQGIQPDAELLERAMTSVADKYDVSRMEQLLKLGGMWRSQYFHNALQDTRIAFCQWAHKRGDLELDLAHTDSLCLNATESIAWLASVGVFISSVTQHNQFCWLARFDSSALPYVLEHYPRYVL